VKPLATLLISAMVIFVMAVTFDPPAQADSLLPDAEYANTQLADPAKEAKAKDLMLTIRCLVCAGQSVADSDADLAGDMRALIRKRIDSGESPGQIRTWLVERYGDSVTYDPPLSGKTAILWIMPLLLLGGGAFLARGRFKRRAK
jgi:cytochrome c-type biogenesis protein CcmH